MNFGFILLILNMATHRSCTNPTHVLSINIRRQASFLVSAESYPLSKYSLRKKTTEKMIPRPTPPAVKMRKEIMNKMFSVMINQALTLSIWFTCPWGTWFWKFTCPAKIFTCLANICTGPVKLMYTAGKVSTCAYWKITCPVGHVTTNVYVPWDKIYMPRACGHTLMSSPVNCN